MSAFRFPFRLLAFWLLFFVVFRLWFVLWFTGYWSASQPGRVWLAFWHALPLDFSFAGYLMALPVLLWQTGLLLGKRVQGGAERLITGYNILIFSIFIFVFGANLFIYEEWQTPLNNRAVQYFKTPGALLDSMSPGFILFCVALYAGFLWLVYKTYRKLIGNTIYPEGASWKQALLLPLWLGLLVLAIRGGTGVMPINESAVYYSPHLFDNHAATNPGWSLGHSLVETRSTANRFMLMDPDTARTRVDHLLNGNAPDITFDFFPDRIGPGGVPEKPKVNVVFLMLESHTAQIIKELGGEDACPRFSALAKEGILFTNIYGSGYRTDQGIVSAMAGYPAQPDQSIILLEDKASKLSSLPKLLHDCGYSTAFFYGGELTFANIGLWLTNQRFDKIFSEKDFESTDKTQRWGVDDGHLLQRMVTEINQLPTPFFTAALTLSLHPPYDVPYTSKWADNTLHDKFLNSAAFVDQAIGAFFDAAAQQSWYDNTIFVLVADHGASPPREVGMDNPVSRHIPLLICGKPILDAWKGMQIPAYGNHHDIPATLLNILKLPPEKLTGIDFRWSYNLFLRDAAEQTHRNADGGRSSVGFAYYTNENGIGWATAKGKGFYEFKSQTWHEFEGKLDSADRSNARAYLQCLYDDFLAK